MSTIDTLEPLAATVADFHSSKLMATFNPIGLHIMQSLILYNVYIYYAYNNVSFCLRIMCILYLIDTTICNSLKRVYLEASLGDQMTLWRRRWLLAALSLLLGSLPVYAAVLRRTWTSQPWCRSVEAPQWPFAYQKRRGQELEWKGRENPSAQDLRHVCVALGVKSKCHRCMPIACGSDRSATCELQLQGVEWEDLPSNIPTVSDVPWAVGGSHRYDFAQASRMCMFLSGGDCVSPSKSDYSKCSVRCWGSGQSFQTQTHPTRGNASALTRGDVDASDIWSVGKGDSKPQGLVSTLAGSGTRGFADGSATTAQFKNPQDVAVDSGGNVYVADTDNHAIRKIDATTKAVTTIAGDGVEGDTDSGGSAVARFSYPMGIAVFEPAGNQGVVIYVADTGNHRIRKIVNGVVSCFAGLCGNGVESATLAATRARPHPGLADGDPIQSRFDSPMGIAVDPATGVVFVADTGNHLIRSIATDGTTTTLAGNVEEANEADDLNGNDVLGCVSPCLRGVKGYRDGNLTHAQFNSPRDVAIGPQSTIVVADGHRIRRVNYDVALTSTIEGISSSHRVVTLAGSQSSGDVDGPGDEASFTAPSGVTVTGDGRVFAVSPVSCKLRQLSPAAKAARQVTCSTKASEVLLPSGCSSYEQPVDELFYAGSPAINNIYYNYRQRYDIGYDGVDPVDGPVVPGRTVRDCTGSPPIDAFDTGDLSLARRIDESPFDTLPFFKEDTGDGTTIKVQCPTNCLMSGSTTQVIGSGMYSDASSICLAAIHSGAVEVGANAGNLGNGLIILTLERGVNYVNDVAVRAGTLANGVQSIDMPPDATHTFSRLFSVVKYPLAQIEVQTIAGAPSALLSRNSGCGFQDAAPPLSARFNGASGIDVYQGLQSLARGSDASKLLVVADSRNHRVRVVTAACSKICENGGTCTGPDTCSCLSGWIGDDCSIPVCSTACGARQVCVGPDTCGCIPGYTGLPACSTPQCAQNCAHGGSCTAPDTCSCSSGWFDSNCTTPVCSQTCGNGGNCTAPDTCTCATGWQGVDCRVPVCPQGCRNGGACVAPDSCLCAAGWSGYDCSIPVCSQGEFVPDPSGYVGAKWRPFTFDNFVPCDFSAWCDATNEFDCQGRIASGRSHLVSSLPSTRSSTNASAFQSDSTNCELIEVGENALTQFPYLDERNDSSGYFRFTPLTPFGWNASLFADNEATNRAPWRGIESEHDDRIDYPNEYFLPPFLLTSDRQVALVERRSVTQGVYACANGGSCIAPDVCSCASGWIGFDCRTPVCTQGYYVASQSKFVAADPPAAIHPRQPTSNPTYTATVESISYDRVDVSTVTRGNTRYLPDQGGYACSIRSQTQWENAEYYDFEHPNYFSRYMDKTLSADGAYHTYWMGMFWPPLYQISNPLLDDTRDGWRRGGIWSRVAGNQWQKGKCLVEFRRVCSLSKENAVSFLDFVAGSSINGDTAVSDDGITTVVDTDASFRPRWVWGQQRIQRQNFWDASLFGVCVDRVLRGCFNNGTCVAPDTCECANGWSGDDCSVPVCSQTCLHGGNCTLPDICTCERGWTGDDCSIPMCAQDCRNGGQCVAPDTCKCKQWASTWTNARGTPVFPLPVTSDNGSASGNAMLTGYTGYDCGTPICVQAETFVLNVDSATTRVTALRGHGKSNSLACTGYRCPQYDQLLVANDGKSFQSGCSVGNPLVHSSSSLSRVQQLENFRAYNDVLNVNRTSDGFLCGVLAWEQGSYGERSTRINYVNVTKTLVAGRASYKQDEYDHHWGVMSPGEGVFMCYHRGTCVAPDSCSCGDGWTGIDCNVPLCRFLRADGSVAHGCQHGGVCVDKDTCKCALVNSTLHDRLPTAPPGLTGYTGQECAVPVCIQGIYDPLCNVSGSHSTADGCYRCKNGGVCVAPDVCQCAKGWQGFDCSEPVCELPASTMTAEVRAQLFTVDESKVQAFLDDPCGENGGRWGKELVNGARIGQGNCTLPHKCTCLCRKKYDPAICDASGEFCEKPWHDPFNREIPAGFVYGTDLCADGFTGLLDADGNHMSCHLQIYVPSAFRRYTVSFVAVLSVASVLALVAYYYIRKRVRRALLLAKAERRRSRKNSASNANAIRPQPGAFSHAKRE